MPDVAAPKALPLNSSARAKAAAQPAAAAPPATAAPAAVREGAGEPAAPPVIVKGPVLNKAAADEPAPAPPPDLDASFEDFLAEVGNAGEDAPSDAAPANAAKEDGPATQPPAVETAATAIDKVPANNGQQPVAKRPKIAAANEVAKPANSEKQRPGGGSAAVKEAVDTRTAPVVPTVVAAATVKAKELGAWGHETQEDRKPAQAPREAWEYLKKDEFGSGNFFDFNKF